MPRRHRALRSLLFTGFLLLGAGPVIGQEGVVELLPDDIQRGVVAASSIDEPEAVPGELRVESAAINVELPSGGVHPAYLITAFDPESRLFWWTFQSRDPDDNFDRIAHLPTHLKFFVSEREIIGVAVVVSPTLWILRSTECVRSFEEGREAALAAIAASAAGIERGSVRWMRKVSLANALPRSFSRRPRDSSPPLELWVRSFTPDGAGWLVTLEGRKGRRAEVRLDRFFTLTSAHEIEAEPRR